MHLKVLKGIWLTALSKQYCKLSVAPSIVLKHHTGGSCGPVAPSTVHSIWWNMRMIFVGENAHMNTPVTCELRHLSGCNMGRFPVCFWSCAIYGSGKHNQTAHTPVAKTPQIQPCSPNTKYVFAGLRGKKMAQVRTLY